MYQGVLGATTTTAAAIVLPNTGSNRFLTVVATVSLVTGVIVMVSTAARMIAKKSIKA